MEFTEEQLSQWLADFFWPLTRIAAMLMAAPIFSIRQIPVRFRMLLAVLITVLVQPVLPPAPLVPVLLGGNQIQQDFGMPTLMHLDLAIQFLPSVLNSAL